MNNTAESNDILQKLCADQPLALLATDAGSGSYASLVAVTVTPDLRRLFFRHTPGHS
jgi:heme iron utilization protein